MDLSEHLIYGAPADILIPLLRRLHASQHGLTPGVDGFAFPVTPEEALLLEMATDRAVAEMREEAADGDEFLAIVQGDTEQFRSSARSRLMSAAHELVPGSLDVGEYRLGPTRPTGPPRRYRRRHHQHR